MAYVGVVEVDDRPLSITQCGVGRSQTPVYSRPAVSPPVIFH